MSRAARLSLALFVSITLSSAVFAAEVLDRYDDGLVKDKYVTNPAGQKIGDYLENYPKGKVKLKCSYKADQLDGPWTSYYESGGIHIKTVYAAGKLHGFYVELDEKGKVLKDQIFCNGLLLYSRSQKQMAATLAVIGAKPTEGPPINSSGGKHAGAPSGNTIPAAPPAAGSGSGGPTDPVNIDTLKQLNWYRYLAGVPWDVTLNADFCRKAHSGAKMLEKLGRLEHKPANPGLPEDEYKMAFDATSNGNLAEWRGTRGSVEGYMNDSDPTNIEHVGHRRWCLNPAMLQTGFGEAGKFSVMYAHDSSRKDVPDFDYVAFPCAGYMPSAFFGPNYAWSVSVNSSKFQTPAADVKAAIYPLLSSGPGVPDPTKRGPPLELDNCHVNTQAAGMLTSAIIFRPKGLSIRGPQTRYWVEITGLKKIDGADAKIEFLVDFCSL